MPNETDDLKLTDEQVDSTLSSWQDEGYIRQLASDEAIHDSIERTKHVLEMTTEPRPDREVETAASTPVFIVPEDAQAILDSRRQEHDRLFDTEAAKSTPRTDQQLRHELEAKGIRREPPDSEEVEAAEQSRLAELRAAARAHHSDTVHEPRPKKSTKLRRPLGPYQQQIADSDKKVESIYGKPS
jgi:hypothetical protein